MNDSKDNKFENKYLEVAIMLCYFLIPFVGLLMALKKYLREDLSFSYILLLLFVAGNIMTSLIFILNDKTLKTKSLWTTGLLLFIVLLNLAVGYALKP